MKEYKSEVGYSAVIVTGGCAGCEELRFSAIEAFKEFPAYKVYYLDEITDIKSLQQLQIQRTPAIILFKDGIEIARVYGYQPTEILALWLESKTQL